MTGFSALKDISNTFEKDLRRVSSELFTAKAGDSYENVISKKLRDITLFTSKLRLLRAKPLASTPQITKEDKSNVIINYEETAIWAIIEQQAVKSFTQTHAVKSLLVAQNNSLNPEMRERKLAVLFHEPGASVKQPNNVEFCQISYNHKGNVGLGALLYYLNSFQTKHIRVNFCKKMKIEDLAMFFFQKKGKMAKNATCAQYHDMKMKNQKL